METHHPTAQSSEQVQRPSARALVNLTSRSESFDQRTRSERQSDSWIEISSQPSSSSLSSAGGDVVTTGLRVAHDPRRRRRRSLRQSHPSNLHIQHRPFRAGGTSSQEEYEESESESDRVMTSSGEYPPHASNVLHAPDSGPTHASPASDDSAAHVSDEEYDDDADEDRTAINYPINNDQCFTPQPNAFSHPPSSQSRNASQPVPGSYFPAQRTRPYSSSRHSLPARHDASSTHLPQNILSPSYNAAAQHEEALRSSLTTLLSCAAAARGLPKSDTNKTVHAPTAPPPKPRSNKVEPYTLRLVPESQLPKAQTQFQEPTFKPTIRRDSTSTSASSSPHLKENKRKATRNSSRERRALKKARRNGTEDLQVSPTLLTWLVSAGVVVFLSALSFSAGYSLGKEAGKIDAGGAFGGAEGEIKSCAKEAGRSGLGLKRSFARSAVQV